MSQTCLPKQPRSFPLYFALPLSSAPYTTFYTVLTPLLSNKAFSIQCKKLWNCSGSSTKARFFSLILIYYCICIAIKNCNIFTVRNAVNQSYEGRKRYLLRPLHSKDVSKLAILKIIHIVLNWKWMTKYQASSTSTSRGC